MRKTLYLGIIAAAFGIASCSTDNDEILRENTSKTTLSLNAIVLDNIETRATIDNSATTWSFSFDPGDNLMVTNSEIGTYYTFTKESTNFTSDAAVASALPATWYAVYPSTVVSLTGQSGTIADLSAKYALAGKTSTTTTGEGGLNIEMLPNVAILKINNQKGFIDINVKTNYAAWVTGLTANDDKFEVVTSSEKVSFLDTDTKGTYYIAVPAGKQIAIKDGELAIKKTTETGLTAGRYYAIDIVPAPWTNALSLGKETATSIVIETNINVSGYTPSSTKKKLNTNGTLWEVLDGTTLRIQTSEPVVKGRNSFSKFKGLFAGYENVTSITGFEKIDMSEVTDMSYMFCSCDNLLTIDLSSFNTAKVTKMDGMFWLCTSLTTLVQNFNTSNVTGMANMFYGLEQISSLNLSNFNTANVLDMQHMFDGCYHLASLTLSDNFKIAPTKDDMFTACGQELSDDQTVEGVIYGVTSDEIKNACKDASTQWDFWATCMKFEGE